MDIEYAGFWRRGVAYLIDLIIIVVGALIIGVAGAFIGIDLISESASTMRFITVNAVSWIYFTLMESSSKQATLGKMAIGIIVTDLDGNRISFGKANGRYWGKIVSGIILFIGFIMAGFTKKKQALHDIMAETLVVMKPKTSTAVDETPEIVTSKPESEPPIGKDSISAKQDIDDLSGPGTKVILAVVLLAVIFIITVISLALNKADSSRAIPAASQQPAQPAPKTDLVAENQAFLEKLGYESPKIEELKRSGISYLEKGDYQQAIIAFNKVIDLEPLNHYAYNSRGEAHLKLGNYQQARADFNRAIIALQREYPLEQFLQYIKENPAQQILEEYLDQTGKKNTVSLYARYYRNRGLAYEKLGNMQQAIDDMKTAAKGGDKEAQKYLLSKEMDW